MENFKQVVLALSVSLFFGLAHAGSTEVIQFQMQSDSPYFYVASQYGGINCSGPNGRNLYSCNATITSGSKDVTLIGNIVGYLKHRLVLPTVLIENQAVHLTGTNFFMPGSYLESNGYYYVNDSLSDWSGTLLSSNGKMMSHNGLGYYGNAASFHYSQATGIYFVKQPGYGIVAVSQKGKGIFYFPNGFKISDIADIEANPQFHLKPAWDYDPYQYLVTLKHPLADGTTTLFLDFANGSIMQN